MAEKTEKATPKKLKDARKKGQVAKSQDLPSAFTFIVSLWVVMASTAFLYHKLGDFLIATFKAVPVSNLAEKLGGVFQEAFLVIFLASLPAMVLVSMVGVLINFLAVGPVFSTEVFKPDIKKFNPVENLKQKFKLKTLVELIKSCLKIFVASWIIYDVMYASIPTLIQAVAMPISSALMIFYAFTMEVIIKVGLFFIVVAVADFAYQKYNFGKEMMMEKFEIKQEYKNTEGNPEIKGKRRQIAQEIAYSEGPAGGVRRAQAVVTNPTHLAVALGYEREVDPAPYIISMGEGYKAAEMVKMAKKLNVPIVRNIKLAHRLWEDGEIYEYVPEDSYEAIAEIMRWIVALESETAYEYQEEKE